jgi:hypothetical protein
MLDEKEIAALEGIIAKVRGGAAEKPTHETNDLQSYGIEELANAVKALMEAQTLITQRVEEICKKVEMITQTSDAFIGNWERLAKEKSRFDGIEGLKSKHGSNPEYAEVARMYQESEGSDMFEVVYDLLSEAREGANNASDSAEQAEFDEDGFVANVFGGVKEKIEKIASLKKPAVTEVAVEVEKEEPKAEEKKDTEKVSMPSVAEQIRKTKKMA